MGGGSFFDDVTLPKKDLTRWEPRELKLLITPPAKPIPVVLWGLNTLINKMVGKPDTTRLSISCSNAQPLNNNCGRVNKKAVDLRTSARPPSF